VPATRFAATIPRQRPGQHANGRDDRGRRDRPRKPARRLYYFVTILGAWKVLGDLAILVPRLPHLKEWAYAGIAFDLTGAAFSHAAVGHPAAKVIVALVLLGIAAASWGRPANRSVGTTKGLRPLSVGP